ncbi:MAG: GLPGLI family protein [Ekhidna sp.]
MLVGTSLKTFAQKKFEGIASYKSSMEVGTMMAAGQDLSPEMKESLRKQIAQQSQRDYTLTFNLQEALWKEEAQLDPVSNPASSGGMQIRIASGAGSSYLNPGKNQFLEEADIFGKKFLIEDELPAFTWKITGETKKIGDYNATKAVFMRISEQTTFSLNDSEQTSQTIMDTTVVVAWFTSEIPVPLGPANSWGLPGLILELKDGNFTYLCTKIELNPDTPVSIVKPDKGKRVTREEADQIRDEKMEEMMKKFDTGDGGSTRVFRIGG